MAQEHEFELDGEGSGAVLELDRTARFARRTAPRFVSGTAAPEMGQCIYCEAPRPLHGPCFSCGHEATAPLSAPPRPVTSAVPLTEPSILEAGIDTLKLLPFGFWKRVPTYSILALVIGNTLLCGGLSARANLTLVVVIILGFVGMAASVSLQRKP